MKIDLTGLSPAAALVALRAEGVRVPEELEQLFADAQDLRLGRLAIGGYRERHPDAPSPSDAAALLDDVDAAVREHRPDRWPVWSALSRGLRVVIGVMERRLEMQAALDTAKRARKAAYMRKRRAMGEA